MPRWLIICNCIILVLLGVALAYVIDSGSNLKFMPSDQIGPSEFVSIVLTALAVILGALTLMIGLLALLGWSSFQSIVEKKAEASAADFLQNRFSDGDEGYLQFIEDIKEDVRVRLLEWTRRVEDWEREQNPTANDPEEGNTVADDSDA